MISIKTGKFIGIILSNTTAAGRDVVGASTLPKRTIVPKKSFDVFLGDQGNAVIAFVSKKGPGGRLHLGAGGEQTSGAVT